MKLTKNQIKIINNIIKAVPKERENMRGIFERKGEYYVTDGLRAIKFKEIPDSNDIEIPKASCDFPVERFFVLAHDYVKAPTAEEIKNHIEKEVENGTKKKDVYFDIKVVTSKPDNKFYYLRFNAKLLLSMVEFLSDCYIGCNGRNKVVTFEKEENGIYEVYGVLCPLRYDN